MPGCSHQHCGGEQWQTVSDYSSKMIEFSLSGCLQLFQVLRSCNTCTSNPGRQQNCKGLAPPPSIPFPTCVSVGLKMWLLLQQATYQLPSLVFPSCTEHCREGHGQPFTAQPTAESRKGAALLCPHPVPTVPLVTHLGTA